MIALIIRLGCACKWPELTVHFATIIALLLQRALYIRNYLIRRQTIIAVNWTVVGVIGIGGVAPCRIPPARIPIIPAAGDKDNAVVVIAPPRAIMPFGVNLLSLPRSQLQQKPPTKQVGGGFSMIGVSLCHSKRL